MHSTSPAATFAASLRLVPPRETPEPSDLQNGVSIVSDPVHAAKARLQRDKA